MKVNEDYILFNENDFDDNLYVCIADGSGSKESTFRPSSIASHQTETFLKRIYQKNKSLLMEQVRFFMEEAFLSANDALIAFKLGDEQGRLNYATSLTAAFIQRNGVLTLAHAGNTRLYVIRDEKVLQVTKDHTEGQKLVDAGDISAESYYTAIERLSLYNGIGISSKPIVQTMQLQLRKNDVVVMTTDGIHYAYKKEAFFDILMNTETMDEAVDEMIQTALKLKVYPDNISANIIWYHGDE